MKKFFEKHDLVKLSGIFLLVSVLLTWAISQGMFQYGEMTQNGISRVGFDLLVQVSLYAIPFVYVSVTFLLILGGFYQVLSRCAGYQTLINSISKKLKGHEVLVTVIVSLIIALWTSVANEWLPILVIIPFIIAILNKLKVDKIAAFSVTFGAILVGTLGSTYSSQVAGALADVFTASYVVVKYILLLISYVLLILFACLRMKKKKSKEDYDMFEFESAKSTKNKPTVWSYAVALILLFLTVFLGFLPWSTWGIELFAKITDWVNNFQVFGIPLYSYLFGQASAFGSEEFTVLTLQIILLFAIVLISLFGRISLNDTLTSIGEGAKKMLKLALILLIINAVMLVSLNFPVIPTIVDWLTNLAGGFETASFFNTIMVTLSAFISSVFGVEMRYVLTLAGNYLAQFSANTDILSIIFQTMYGLAQFFVPTSLALMLGLSYLDIRYNQWMKYIWKYLIAILILSVIIIAVMLLFVL